MTIIPFPTKPYITISSQVVVETRRVSCDGTARVCHDPPLRIFIIELVEADGCAVVWDGNSYPDALDAASDWAADDVEVRDRVAATWRRT